MASQAELGILLKARDEASSVLKDVGKVALGLAAAFVAGAGVAIKAAADEQAGIERLTQAVKNSGQYWDGINVIIEENVHAMEKSTAFSDDELRAALAGLVVEVGDVDGAMDRLTLAANFARGAHIDLATASKLLGRVTDETVNVLGRYGIHVDKNTKSTELLAIVQQRFGGQAAAYAATAQGQWENLQNQLGNLIEDIGVGLLPLFTKGVGMASDFIEALRGSGELQVVIGLFKTVTEILGEMFGVISGQAPDAGGKLKEIVGPEAASFIMGGLALIRESFKTALQAISGAIDFLKENWDAVAFAMKIVAVTVVIPAFIAWSIAAVSAAAATIIALAPVLIPIAAIGAAAFLLYKLWTENFGGIQEQTKAVIDFIYGLLDAFGAFFAGLWQNLRGPVEAAIGFIMAPINSLISIVQTALGWLAQLNSAPPPPGTPGTATYTGPSASQLGYTTNPIQGLASGTPMITRGGLFNLHPGEAVLSAEGNAGGGVHIHFHGNVYGMEDFRSEVRAAIRDRDRRGGQ